MSLAPRVLSRRRAGVLLPLSALLVEAEGALGPAAFGFVDWLAEAGFSVWQVLPLVPAGGDGSPYWSRSDRAGDERLVYRRAADRSSAPASPPARRRGSGSVRRGR